MGKAEKTTEAILNAAQALILESDGDAQRVTIRQVADRAEVSVGLVNYYFSSKTKLIEACVQRMIGSVVSAFQPILPEQTTSQERLGLVASQVADYLEQHEEISRISILGDCNSPNLNDNTFGTMRGFCYTIDGGEMSTEALQRAFCLTAVLQSVFLRKDILKDSIGVDWNEKLQRDDFLKHVCEWIL